MEFLATFCGALIVVALFLLWIDVFANSPSSLEITSASMSGISFVILLISSIVSKNHFM